MGNFLPSIIQPISDVLATVTGNPELIPLINAGEGFATNLAQGKGFGKSLESGAITGGESLAGQEAFGALGIGNGNSAVNDALGINISPSNTGLPDIGQGISNLFGGGNAAGTSAGATTAGSSSTPTATPTATPSAGAATGGTLPGAAGASAPASVPLSSPDVTLSGGGGTNLSTGGANVGTPSIDNVSAGSIGTPSGGIDNILNGGSSVKLPTGSGASGGGGSNSGGFLSNLFGGGSSTPNVGNVLGVSGGGSSSGSGIGGFLGRNAGALIPAATLGYEALTQTPPKGTNQLTDEANQLSAQGNQLQSYLNSGTLPPGAQNSLNQAAQQAQAAIRSQYAARGMSGSSAEAQDLANVAQQTAAQGQQLAMNLLQQGVSETNLSSQLYQTLMKDQMEGDASLGSAITNFATAAAGGAPGGGTFKIVGA